jgi:hypothetical protein
MQQRAPEPTYPPPQRQIIGSGGGPPTPGGGTAFSTFIMICFVVLILLDYFDALPGAFNVASIILDFIGAALSFIFSPVRYYFETFGMAMNTQHIRLPFVIYLIIVLFPIEVGFLLLITRGIRQGSYGHIADLVIGNLVADFLVSICFLLIAVYLSIISHQYNEYFYLMIGMAIVSVLTLIVRLIRSYLFFPQSAKDVYDAMSRRGYR